MLDALQIALLAGFSVYIAFYFLSKDKSRAVLEAKSAEARFRALLELSADWFWETDAEHRIVWISGGAPVATFFGPVSVYGKRFWELPGVEVEARALETCRERLAQHLPFFDLEIARSDERGARQVHIISGQSRLDAQGRFLGYRGVGRDVTEQRSAERKLFEAKERLELALDGADLAEWHIDLGRQRLEVGDGWARFLGYDQSPEVASVSAGFALVHPEDQEGFRDAFVACVKGEAPEFEREFRMRHKSGRWRWLHARGRVTAREPMSGRALHMSGTLADVDTRKRAENALRESALRFDDVADLSREYVWETDAQWRYTYLSERVEEMLGFARAEMLGRTPREFMPLGEHKGVEQWFQGNSQAGGAFRELVHRSVTKSGGVVWQSVSGVPVRDAAGNVSGYRGTAADVTARRQAEARIEYLATRDALTGLPNRILLADRAAQMILAGARASVAGGGARGQLAMLCIDLDRFKLVNDSLDHAAGDELLRAVAARLQELAGDGTLARLGGDDFVLLQPVKNVDEAGVLAQRILTALARPFEIEGETLGVAASIGISVYPSDGRDFAELLKNADAAMYHAKESGRGTFRFFSPALNARAMERLRLENELRGALGRGELLLHWHPVLKGQGLIAGAEALVRWKHPERGLLQPEEFVPLAEECGLIRAVGEWTLERAVSQAGAWSRKLPGRPWVAVNVSAQELAQGDAYYEKVRTCLRDNMLDGDRLELEVTERVLMSNLAENLDTLRQIGSLGVRFAIDDFGTGYSSLAYLRILPVHKIKIDRSFLREIETHPADEAIVRAIAAMASTLGIEIAAEGVENEAQLKRLLALGCEQWQGHHFSQPVEAPAFEKLSLSQARSARRI
ncbi:MAG TPA: EAL domain-containing protein [Burkholderiales bacterium]|nr:EAL domain-containing protein [Burkholderiales bacterium]